MVGILTSIHGMRLGLDASDNLVIGGPGIVFDNNGTPATLTRADLASLVSSARIVDLTAATLTLTQAAHQGKTILLDRAAGCTVTLPAASGSGAKYNFAVKTVPTTNQHKVQVANATDIIQGTALVVSDNSAAVLGYAAGATDDTITLNGTTTGGLKIGDTIEIEDIAAGVFRARVISNASGTEATPFSAAVS